MRLRDSLPGRGVGSLSRLFSLQLKAASFSFEISNSKQPRLTKKLLFTCLSAGARVCELPGSNEAQYCCRSVPKWALELQEH